MKIKILLIAVLMMPFSLTFASTGKGIHCPTVDVIRKTQFLDVLKGDHPTIWTARQLNENYHTSQKWNLSMMIDANNHKEAYKKASKALANMRFKKGPYKIENTWVCDYQSKLALDIMAKTIEN